MALFAGACLTACSTSSEPTPSTAPTSEKDANLLLAECLRDRGWQVTIEGGAVTPGQISNDQLPVYLKDADECSAEVNPPREFSVEEWTQLYESQLKEARCLEREFGYPYDPPSLQEYLDTATTPEQWAPFAEMVNAGFPVPGGYTEAAKKCPQPWM